MISSYETGDDAHDAEKAHAARVKHGQDRAGQVGHR
jgi:hypothetical protein